MFYCNKVSKQVISLTELCCQENASIASGLPYGQWVPVIADPYPTEPQEGMIYTLGEMQVTDEAARQAWVASPAPVQETPAP